MVKCKIYLTKCKLYVIYKLVIEMSKNLLLKSARVQKGMTQTDLANAVEVSRQTIVAIESGDYNPTINLCIKICKVLGKTLDELFWEEV